MDGLSRRSQLHADTNALTRAVLEHRARGLPTLNLAESNPTQVGLSWPHEELAQALGAAGISRYEPEPFGLLEARRALSAELARTCGAVPAERLMLTASTSEAYGFLFKLLCDAGDNVLVPSPSYPLFDVLAGLEGVRLVPYRLAYDGEWHIDLPALRASIDARTRAILLVHPNNPTGSYLKREELRALASLGLPLISDEVFAPYALRDDVTRAPSALDVSADVLVFRLDGLSKSAALPQLKLAWTAIAGPAPLVEEACERLQHIADTCLSANTPAQLALPRLLAFGATVRGQVRARIEHNLAALERACVGSPLSVLRTEGGWYAVLRLPALRSDEEWAISLLERDGVLTQPGFFYDLEGTHLVLSLITQEEVFAEGIARLVRRVTREATSP